MTAIDDEMFLAALRAKTNATLRGHLLHGQGSAALALGSLDRGDLDLARRHADAAGQAMVEASLELDALEGRTS